MIEHAADRTLVRSVIGAMVHNCGWLNIGRQEVSLETGDEIAIDILGIPVAFSVVSNVGGYLTLKRVVTDAEFTLKREA